MDRSEVYYQFIAKHPNAEEHIIKVGDDCDCSIMLGMMYDVVDEMFVGLYYSSGQRRAEQRVQEDEMRNSLGVQRVIPEDAIKLGKLQALSFAGLLKKS